MCNPIMAIGTIIKGGATASAVAGSAAAAANVAAATATLGQFAAIGSGVLGIASASQAHQAQKAQYQTNKESAIQAQTDEQRQINLQQAQEQEKAAQQQLQTDLETKQAASRVKATDTGASLNNNAVIQDIMRQGLVSNTSVTQNLERSEAQLNEERLGAKSRAQSRINSVSRPSSTATGLKIGGSMLSSASAYTSQ